MVSFVTLKDLFILGSVLGLVLVGAWIALQSGLVAASRERGSRLLANASRLGISLIGGAAVMTFVQQWIGLRLAFLP